MGLLEFLYPSLVILSLVGSIASSICAIMFLSAFLWPEGSVFADKE